MLNSNSISLTPREPAVATLEATRGEGSKSTDREGTHTAEEERRQWQEEEDQRKKLQEQLTLERERELKEQQYQEELEQKRRQAEAEEQKRLVEEQMRQAERERETSVRIYQYRRSVPIPQRTCGFSTSVVLLHPFPTSKAPNWFSCSPASFLYTGGHKQPECTLYIVNRSLSPSFWAQGLLASPHISIPSKVLPVA